MKNFILFFLWAFFLALIIFNFKAEESVFVVRCSLLLAIIPTFLFVGDVFYSIKMKWNRSVHPTVGILIVILIIGALGSIFYFLPDEHIFNFVVLMWVLSIASSKLSKGGIIKKILNINYWFNTYQDFDSAKSTYKKRYTFLDEIGAIFCSLSPFHR